MADLNNSMTPQLIKIAFVIDTIESPTAGTEKQLLMLIKHLDRTKFVPTLFVLRSSAWLEKEFDLSELEVIGFNSFFNLTSHLRLIKFIYKLRKNCFDCIQTHFVESNIIGVIAAKLAGIRAIYSSRRDQGYWHTPGKLVLYKLLNRWIFRFVANCYSTAEWAAKVEKIALDRIEVIYNGVYLENFIKKDREMQLILRREIGFHNKNKIVAVVANLRPVKNVDIFIKAAAIVSKNIPSARFLIVGDGELRNDLEKLAIQLGVLDKIKFLGKRVDVAELLSICDIGVLSSASESFSNSIVEYMAAGLPVVATDVGGCKEIIEDGVNGFVVPAGQVEPMAEKINVLLNMPSYDLEIMSNGNLDKVKKVFSSNVMVTKFEQMYMNGALK